MGRRIRSLARGELSRTLDTVLAMIVQVEVVLVLMRLVILRTFIHSFCVSRQDIRILWVSFIFVSQSGLQGLAQESFRMRGVGFMIL